MSLVSRPSRFRRSGRWALALALVAPGTLLTTGTAEAATITVPGSYPTIQQALDAASAGDTVVVSAGSYPENLDFHGKDVRLQSSAGAAVTTLAVPGGRGVDIGPGGAFVGFTVTGATESFGSGLAVSGDGTLIEGNVFDGNAQGAGGYGAAIGGNVASPTINRNVFRNNSCDGQFLSGVVSFINGSSPRITNNVFQDNPCRGVNLTLPEGAAPVVENNTMVGNRAGVYVDTRIPAGSQVIRNNVIVGNEIGLEVQFFAAGNEPTFDHNDVFGNDTDYSGIGDRTGQDANLSVDPGFVDQAAGDVHLRPGSPVVDAGSAVGAPVTDLDGRPRPVDGNGDGVAGFDLGAYELAAGTGLQVAIDVRPASAANRISLRNDVTVPVAVLSQAGFAAPSQVDRRSLTFGRTGTEASLVGCAAAGRDVNADGRRDLVCTFRVAATGFRVGDTIGKLSGRTVAGAGFTASGPVRVVR